MFQIEHQIYTFYNEFCASTTKLQPNFMKEYKWVFLLQCILILSGCGKNVSEERQSLAVKTTRVVPVDMVESEKYSGTIEETTGATLSFAVPGTVRSIHAVPGQRVTRGQLIATIDDSSLRSAYNAAESTLRQAEDAYTRMEQLHNNNSLPEIQWVEVQTKLQQARSAEQMARKSLADTRITAPFSGVIASKDVEVGHNVLPGQPVAKIVTVNQVKVKISMPESDIAGTDSPRQSSLSTSDNLNI